MAVSNKIEYPGFARSAGQGQRKNLGRSTSGIVLALISLGSVVSSSKYSIFSLMMCPTPDFFVGEEEQEHHTPSLQHDNSNQERTYTRLVVSCRKFRISTTAYCQAGRRNRRFDCHGIAATTNLKRRSHSLTRTHICLNTTHSHPSERRLPTKTLNT